MFSYYIQALTKDYLNYHGRTTRKAFWSFTFIDFLITLFPIIIFSILGLDLEATTPLLEIFNIVYFIYWVGTAIPSLFIRVRRLHDINKSGWWLLISLIPLIGTIVLLVFFCIKGDIGQNNFGDNPEFDNLNTIKDKDKDKEIIS